VLEGHTDSVRALAVLPDGRVVSGIDDKSVRIWSSGTGS
jgi:WD40 repeat protein